MQGIMHLLIRNLVWNDQEARPASLDIQFLGMSVACPPNSFTNDLIPQRASKEQEAILEDQVAQRHG